MINDAKTPAGRAKKILVVDDHPLIRDGLAARIMDQVDLEICGEAASVDEALTQVTSTNPDLVIVDIQLTESHGIDLIKEIHARFPSIKMLVVSAFDESLFAERALRAGAHGYMNKRELQDSVLDAIRMVLAGERYLSLQLTRKLIAQAVDGKNANEGDPIQRLSDRELEVFQLIGEGVTTRTIARRLDLSTHTIDTHRENIKQKLQLRTGNELQREATQWVLENG